VPDKNDDDKAIEILQKAVDYAQQELVDSATFRPFSMVLVGDNVEIIQNSIEDRELSYDEVCRDIEDIVSDKQVDILVIAIDTAVPDEFAKDSKDDTKSSIRLHLEERSQLSKDISARYIYVPYQLYQKEAKELFVQLYRPIPVGLIAEYIKK